MTFRLLPPPHKNISLSQIEILVAKFKLQPGVQLRCFGPLFSKKIDPKKQPTSNTRCTKKITQHSISSPKRVRLTIRSLRRWTAPSSIGAEDKKQQKTSYTCTSSLFISEWCLHDIVHISPDKSSLQHV